MGNDFGFAELGFLLTGLGWTVVLSAIAFLGGGVAALFVALGRAAESNVLRTATAAYIAVFQGTLLLMQMFVVYYGLGLVGILVPAWVAVALAFTFNASAFLGDIWRESIQAVPGGQREAARALGIGYVVTMHRVVLPQALRIAQPATVGYLVQVIKGTSLAAIVGFIELTRSGQIVSNQTYQPILVFGMVGVIYFALCWPLSLASTFLERRVIKVTR